MTFMARVGARFQSFRERVSTFKANLSQRLHRNSDKKASSAETATAERNKDLMLPAVSTAAAAATAKLWTPGSEVKAGSPADLWTAGSAKPGNPAEFVIAKGLTAADRALIPPTRGGIVVPESKSLAKPAMVAKAEAPTAPAVLAPKVGPKGVLEYSLTNDAIKDLVSKSDSGLRLGLGLPESGDFNILDATLVGTNAKGQEVRLQPAISGIAPNNQRVGPNGHDLAGVRFWPTSEDPNSVLKGKGFEVKLGINRQNGNYDTPTVFLPLQGFEQTLKSNQR